LQLQLFANTANEVLKRRNEDAFEPFTLILLKKVPLHHRANETYFSNRLLEIKFAALTKRLSRRIANTSFFDRYFVVETNSSKISKLYLINSFEKSIAAIPDLETASAFGYKNSTRFKLINLQMKHFLRMKPAIPSIKRLYQSDLVNPLAVVPRRAKILSSIQHSDFIKVVTFAEGFPNPSIVTWRNLSLISWKTGWSGDKHIGNVSL